MRERLTITTDDGRALEVEHGPLDGTPLLFHFGTPCAGRLSDEMIATGRERGIAHVTYSRPGYSRSSRRPGRTVAGCAGDVAAVADALGLDHFYVAGISGGGPHALATAALLGERTLATATIGSVAPRDAEGLDWTAGMAEENIEEFAASEAGEEPLRVFLEKEAAGMAGADGEQLREALGSLVARPDAEAMQGPYADFMAVMMGDAVSNGIWGWLDDDLAFEMPWGFELATIDSPLTVWHGAQDMFVPVTHGEWLASHIPRASVRIEPDHGHLSRLGLGYAAILDDLIAASS